MAYWLIKSEPNVFSWDDLVATKKKGEPWDGVRNHQAKLNLKAMKKGDRAFFYHSNIGKEVVGIAEVKKEAYPDPTADPDSPWVCCDFVAITPAETPMTLAQAKADPALKDMFLVNNTRLSVQPVTAKEWKHVCKVCGMKG